MIKDCPRPPPRIERASKVTRQPHGPLVSIWKSLVWFSPESGHGGWTISQLWAEKLPPGDSPRDHGLGNKGEPQTNSQEAGQLENLAPRPHHPPSCNLIGWIGGSLQGVNRWEDRLEGWDFPSSLSPTRPRASPPPYPPLPVLTTPSGALHLCLYPSLHCIPVSSPKPPQSF